MVGWSDAEVVQCLSFFFSFVPKKAPPGPFFLGKTGPMRASATPHGEAQGFPVTFIRPNITKIENVRFLGK